MGASAVVAIVASVISAGVSVRNNTMAAKRAETALNYQIQADEEAKQIEKERALEAAQQQRDSEKAKTEYGSGADQKIKAMASNDLLVPVVTSESIGGSNSKTGLGF